MILAACLRVGRAKGKETVTDKALGNRVAIRAENLSAENYKIASVRLNGAEYDKGYIDYTDIIAGGDLVFVME